MKACFSEHGLAQFIIVLRVQGWVRCGGVDVAQVQPIVEEVVDESVRARIIQHAVHLHGEHLGLGEFLFVGEAGQFVIG